MRKYDMKKKIAVLFPGIGYTCDKPLLYYAGKLAAVKDYEILKVEYGNFPSGIKGDKEKMEEAFLCGLKQAEDILCKVCWEEYQDILFISKSIGTIISSAFAKKHKLKVENILFTPLHQTFQFADKNGIVFHGTADPWANTEDIIEGCKELKLPLFLTDQGNHSLETGKVLEDLKNLEKVMEVVNVFIESKQVNAFL